MGFDCHESSTKFCTKWGAGVVANKSAKGRIRGGRAATVESIAENADPTNSPTCSCEPLVDGSSA